MRSPLRQPPRQPTPICFCLAVSTFHSPASQPQNTPVFYLHNPPPPSIISPFSPPITTAPQSLPSSKKIVVGIAVGVIAASILLVAGLLFVLISQCRKKRRLQQKQNKFDDHIVPIRAEPPAAAHGGTFGEQNGSAPYKFRKFEGNLKGLIVDENGLGVFYWRKLVEMSSKKSSKDVFKKADESRKNSRRMSEKEPIQEMPLLHGKSSASLNPVIPDSEPGQFSPITEHNPYPTSSPEICPPKKAVALNAPPPPPPPPIKAAIKNPPPLPPPIHGVKPPAMPPQKAESSAEKKTEQGYGSGSGAVKMKPLHWDKLNANVEHSMVWDKIDGGSFRFDGDMMQALFGYVAKNRKSPQLNSAAGASEVFILDSKKSQNIAIVLKSMTVSCAELVEGLMEGRGLSSETLEKLERIAPSKEEEELILGYDGDPTKLAFVESFLFQILKAVPTAFDRVSAMVFQKGYDAEVGSLKEMVKLVKMGCEELRRRGLFLTLLEAVLKAGNRLNAGTSRGNAQAFNLTALLKLSDVKSTDGKTTLLHFVVEEVMRSEGKSLSRSDSRRSNDEKASKEDVEKDYMMLGLPIVEGLSSEFSNLKKASAIDYDQFSKGCRALEARVAGVRQIVLRCSATDGDRRFAKEMSGFVESAEQELRFLKEEQKRVMELLRKTTEYYQTGALKDKEPNHFHLFVIVNDFLAMVDQVCIEIARNAHRRKASGAAGSDASSTINAAGLRTVKFPNLPEHFMSEKSMCNSSGDGDESADGP